MFLTDILNRMCLDQVNPIVKCLCLEILFISHLKVVAGSLFIDMKESQVWRGNCDRDHTTDSLAS